MSMTAKQATKALNLLKVPVSSENLRRVARAKTYLDQGKLVMLGIDGPSGDRIYKVVGSEVYDVALNGTHNFCSCPDAQKSTVCKHQLACMMLEFKLEQQAIRAYEEYEADRFACDGNELY